MSKLGVVNFRLRTAEYERLSALAARRGVTVSSLARRALARGLREYERRTPVAPALPIAEPEEPAA